MNSIIKNLPVDNHKYYIKHEDGLNTFTLCVNQNQQRKDNLYMTILNFDKKISRLKNKAEITELIKKTS